MKALLINPCWNGRVSKKGKRFNRAWPPLSLLNCASLLEEEGFEVKLIDARAEGIEIDEIADTAKYSDMVFITSSPIDRWQCPNLEFDLFIKMVNSIPSEDLFIMGVHGTIYPEQLLLKTGAKAIISGEPEPTVVELAEKKDLSKIKGITYKINDKIITNPDRQPIDLSTLPVPAYHLLNKDKYYYELLGKNLALFEGSRGCPHNCSFCLKVMYGNGIRYKPVENLLNEIEVAVERQGFKHGYFIDLEFTLNKERIKLLCKGLTEKNYDFYWCCQTRPDTVDEELLKEMKGAGCRLIHYGVETGSEKVMKNIKKKVTLKQVEKAVLSTQKTGMEAACFFLFGLPGEKKEDMLKTIAFAKGINPAYASFHIATPYPGTEFYMQNGNEELFPEFLQEEHQYETLSKMTRKAYLKFYVRPGYIFSRIKDSSPKALIRQAALFREFAA
ncbi:MAG: radical SAM protein [Thermodesulfobacteriota bacterium]|nr:radical SAM protein [Thermodesulfobacteriota bacterium]